MKISEKRTEGIGKEEEKRRNKVKTSGDKTEGGKSTKGEERKVKLKELKRKFM